MILLPSASKGAAREAYRFRMLSSERRTSIPPSAKGGTGRHTAFEFSLYSIFREER